MISASRIRQPRGRTRSSFSPGIFTNTFRPVRYRNVWVIPKVSAQEQWESWVGAQELDPADQKSFADPDADGMKNLWEYATGGDPAAADLFTATGESRTPQMTVADDHHLEFTFIRRVDFLDRGLDFQIETSPTMAANSWTARPASLVGPPEAIGDGLERVTLRVDESVAGSLQMFARVRAELRD